MSTFHPDREVVIAMHETEGITHDKIDRLFTEGAIDGARSRRPADWRDLGLRAKEAKALAERLRPEAIEAAIRRREKAGISIVTALDAGYPMQLRHTHRFPWVLYYIGNLALARKSSVAIVGTRSATSYGRRVAEELALACSMAGLVVVSGMAKGIDACAHAGALQGPAGTVAVLGGPVDSPYPRENAGYTGKLRRVGLFYRKFRRICRCILTTSRCAIELSPAYRLASSWSRPARKAGLSIRRPMRTMRPGTCSSCPARLRLRGARAA
ncbi:DNA-processing protein DprA [Cohnella algarum]|nr:DNA-processing protein DprA [Cohnella algarum]MBN2983585.1 DNA-processing protein DprA [Cohnella algarum]